MVSIKSRKYTLHLANSDKRIICIFLIPEYARTEYQFSAFPLLFSPNPTDTVCRKKGTVTDKTSYLQAFTLHSLISALEDRGRHVPCSAPGLPVLRLLQYPKLQLLGTDVAWSSNIMLDILIFHVHLQLQFGLPRWLSW